MDYSDLVRQARIDQILRERVALGGCGDSYGFGEDFSDYVGGARTKGAKDKNPARSKVTRSNALKNWQQFLKRYRQEHDVEGYSVGEVAQFASAEYRRQGLKKSPSKKSKAPPKKTKMGKAPAKKGKTPKKISQRYGQYGYSKKPPTKAQLNALGMTMEEFLEEFGDEPISKRRRVGLRYLNKVSKGPNKDACFKPYPQGPYWINAQGVCVKKN